MATILWTAAATFGFGLAYSIIVPGQRADRTVSFVFWYVLPALGLLLSVLALRSSVERRLGAVLLLVSLIGSVFAAEAFLRAFPAKVAGFSMTSIEADSICPGEWLNQAGCLAAADAGVPFDRRTTLEVVRDLEARGIEAWPSIDASHFLDPDNAIAIDGRSVVPLSPGIPDVLTVFCNESGDWVTYEADEYGFNNPPGSHAPGEVKIALLGDSFVHGWCVPFDQTIVGQLRQFDHSVLGIGLEGSGPLVQLGMEREYLAPLRPALVIWLFYEGNDLRDLLAERESDVLPRYLEPEFRQGLRALTPLLAGKLRERVRRLRSEEAARMAEERERRRSALRRRRSVAGWIRLTELKTRLSTLGRSRTPEQIWDPAAFAGVAARMRDDVSGWGGKLVFAYLPSHRRFDDRLPANPHREAIMEQVRELDIPMIDLYETLARHSDPMSLFPFRVESHLTAEGDDLVARALVEGIEALEAGKE
ncbi:MAG: hypothetical protein Q8W45_10390 [Candidatus Palauibacterales bacterium]|nr:hypothetical protein [Candidatus Palauibacterales bacterium]MDP2483683.1 hypothetical protein [Candidatus Palauibacterales bacterium]